MKLQNRLEEIRWEMRIEKKDLAELIGVRPQKLSLWLHQKQQPSNFWMLRIARVLGRPVEDIFYLSE